MEDDGNRYRWSREHSVTLGLDEVEICQAPGAEPVLFPSQVNVYLGQRDRDRQARVSLSRNGSAGIDLPLTEARKLVQALGDVIRQAAICS